MPLHQDIKRLLDERGKDFGGKIQLVNTLDDMGAFAGNKALKRVFRHVVRHGYFKKILHWDSNLSEKLIEFHINGLVDEVSHEYGYNKPLVEIVIRGLAFGCGLTVNFLDLLPAEETAPATLTQKVEVRAGNVRFTMVRVEGGNFLMGATTEQGIYARYDEKPAQDVKVDTFWMADTPVTQELWTALGMVNDSRHQDLLCPVECVNCDQIQSFIQALNISTGRHFRLPTEAEWEFAARGGLNSQGHKYAGCDDAPIGNFCWYLNNSDGQTHRVAMLSANGLDLFDMSGNVWEWCSTPYDASLSVSLTQTVKASSNRVIRGGSFLSPAERCRVSARRFINPSNISRELGFRLVADDME